MIPEPIMYVVGDATFPIGTGPRIIVHICNDIGAWGKGFVLALSKRWKEPEQQYRAWHISDTEYHAWPICGTELPFGLGEVQFVQVVQVDSELWVANLIGQHGVRSVEGLPPIRYAAVRKGLQRVAEEALRLGATVHMPRIGCGLAGGEWADIEPIVSYTFRVESNIPVTVYDLP